MAKRSYTPPDELAENTPAVWMLRLECYRAIHDFHRAAAAQDRLRELGVEVKYLRPRKRRCAMADPTINSVDNLMRKDHDHG